MKSKKFEKKLALNKETVAHLNRDTLTGIKAGVLTIQFTCFGGNCDSLLTCGARTVCVSCWTNVPTVCATDCVACV